VYFGLLEHKYLGWMDGLCEVETGLLHVDLDLGLLCFPIGQKIKRNRGKGRKAHRLKAGKEREIRALDQIFHSMKK
jgi:hypothetical protein